MFLSRLVQEKIDLDLKLSKILKFKNTDLFKTLSDYEKNLLISQSIIMKQYSDTLKLRIELYK